MSETLKSPATSGDANDLDEINKALRGPVTEICQIILPQLKPLSRAEAYEKIMNTPELAAQCFREFRRRPRLFEDVLRGTQSGPVTSDDQPLRCGQTLNQIIALIVRAIAKRHFRSKLDQQRRLNPRPPVKPTGLWQTFMQLFQPQPPPAPPRRKQASRAAALYEAFKEFLRYDWQVILIPQYVRLPVPLVQELGTRILEFREVEQIAALADGAPIPPPLPPVPTPAVAPAPPPSNALSSAPPGKPVSPAAARKRDPASILQHVNVDVIRRLNGELGLSNRQIAICYIRASEVLPRRDFATFVRTTAGSDDMERFVAAARHAGLGPGSGLDSCAKFVDAFFPPPKTA